MAVLKPFAFVLPCVLAVLAQTPIETPDPDCGEYVDVEPHSELCVDGGLLIDISGQIVDGLTRPVPGVKVYLPSSSWNETESSSILTDASGEFIIKAVLSWYDRLSNDTDITQRARIVPYTSPFTIKISKAGYGDRDYTFCAPRNAAGDDDSGTIRVGALRIFRDWNDTEK